MARFVRTQTIEHAIGPEGRLIVGMVEADLRLKAVEGDAVRAVATFEIPAKSDAEADELFERLKLRVDADSGSLRIEERNRRPGFAGLARLFDGIRIGIDLEIDAPANCRLDVEAVSADVTSVGFHGGQRYKTVSGDMRLTEVRGALKVDAVSGDIRLDADGATGLQVHTVSGDLSLEAPSWVELRASTVSGDVEIDGRLEADHDHSVDTVSGDFRLALVGGATINVHGLSTDISASVPHRAEGPKDRRRLIVGDGSARLAFSSMSGDFNLAKSTADAPAPAPAAPAAPPAPSAPPAPRPDAMELLRALEAGEITVDEAARRLAEPKS
jgi:hypothetical protein